MGKASRRGRIGRAAAGLALALAVFQAIPALAQETPQQFDAVNVENRRHTAAQSDLRNQAHDLRTDQQKALLGCQGAGSAGATAACTNNANITLQQRSLDLRNQTLQERNTHNQIIQGLGVHRAQ